MRTFYVRTALLLAMLLAMFAGAIPASAHRRTHEDGPVGNGCKLELPDHLFTPRGLATPFRLHGRDVNGASCVESDPNEAAFAEAVLFDRTHGTILGIYHPLIVDMSHPRPAAPPTVPQFDPATTLVGIWFGSNGTVLRLGNRPETCIDKALGSPFGQMSACNAPMFFLLAHQAVQRGTLTVPALGTAVDGLNCPTTRDFSVVDQDPSDNVVEHELVTPSGYAQNTPSNVSTFGNHFVFNGSDEGLLDGKVNVALHCNVWTAPLLEDASGASMGGAQALNEIRAAEDQAEPLALIPLNDPMALRNGRQNLVKLNMLRSLVGQPPEPSLAQAQTDQEAFCTNLWTVGVPRLAADKQYTLAVSSPFPETGDSLYTFLAARLYATWGNLGCQNLLTGNPPPPVTLTVNPSGVVTDATYILHP